MFPHFHTHWKWFLDCQTFLTFQITLPELSEGVQGHAQCTELWKAEGVSQGTCLDHLLVFIQGHCYLRVMLSLTPGSLVTQRSRQMCVGFVLSAPCFHNLGGRDRKSRKRKRAEIQPIIRRPDMAVAKLFQMNTLAPPSRLGNHLWSCYLRPLKTHSWSHNSAGHTLIW